MKEWWQSLTILGVMHGTIECTKHEKTKTQEWKTVKQDTQETHKLIIQRICKIARTSWYRRHWVLRYLKTESRNSMRCISKLKPSWKLRVLPFESPWSQLSKTSKIIIKLLFTKKISSIENQQLRLFGFRSLMVHKGTILNTTASWRCSDLLRESVGTTRIVSF